MSQSHTTSAIATSRRGELPQKCFSVLTYGDEVFEVRGLSREELSVLTAADLPVDTNLKLGFWGDPRRLVVSVIAEGRELISYQERRSKIMARGQRRVVVGGLVLAAIALAMLWRIGSLLTGRSGKRP
jgi:hypothetical protein